jgi:hypothetical protein
MPATPHIPCGDLIARETNSSSGDLRILDPLAIPNWDSLVVGLPGSTFFHTAAWARVLEQSYDYKPAYFAVVKEGAIQALLPAMEVNSWLTGRRGVSLPFSDACPALALTPAGRSELIEQALQHGGSRQWKYWEGRDVGPTQVEVPPSASFLEHTLDLGCGEDELFAQFDSSVRRAIRKAEKSGLTLHQVQSAEGMQLFYDLHCQTRQKHGVPPQPFSFFQNFQRYVLAQNNGFVMVACLEEKPVAASVFVHFGQRAIYKYGASDETFQNLRGANLVMWRAIQWYLRAGFEQLHFGRTDWDNEGLRRFKLGWGTAERTISYSRYNFRQSKFVTGPAAGPGWSNHLFRVLPNWISRLAGGFLYRHVA